MCWVREARRPWWSVNDQGNKIQRRLCKPDLSLKRLILAVRKAEAQDHRPICEALANAIDIFINYRFHGDSHGVVAKRSYGRHVCRFAIVSLVA
jgi:hypothetical protein